MAKELPYQTYQRIFGDERWPGGRSAKIVRMLKELGIKYSPGSAKANLALQAALLRGWRPSWMRKAVPAKKVVKPPAPKIKKPPVPSPPSPAVRGVKHQIDTIKKELEEEKRRTEERRRELAQRMEVLEKREEKAIQKMMAMKPPQVEALRETWKEFKVKEQYNKILERVGKIEELENELVELKRKKEEDIARVRSTPAPVGIMGGMERKIEEEWNVKIAQKTAEINAEAAILETIRGNIQTARALVNDYVKAATYDFETRYQKLRDFLNLNRDIIRRVSSEIERNIVEKLNIQKVLLQEARQERETIGELMIKYPEADIKWNDDLLTAYAKVSQVAPIVEERNMVRELMARYPYVGIDESDSYEEAIGKIAPYLRKQYELEIATQRARLEQIRAQIQKLRQPSGGELPAGEVAIVPWDVFVKMSPAERKKVKMVAHPRYGAIPREEAERLLREEKGGEKKTKISTRRRIASWVGEKIVPFMRRIPLIGRFF